MIRTTVSRDPAVVALLSAREDYPGASAMLDAADRQWLRAQGVEVPPKPPEVPLHESARLARQKRAAKKKSRGTKKGA